MRKDHGSRIQFLSEKSGIPVPQLEDYLKFIKAPPNFKNGQAAVRGFTRLLSVPLVKDLQVPNLDEFMIINSHLENALSTVPHLDEFTIPEQNPATSAAHGMLTDYPEYTVLFFHSQNHQTIIEQMKQLIWVGHAQATQNDVSDYCRFIRVLSEVALPQILVDGFPKSNPSANEVYQSIVAFVESEDSQTQIQNSRYTANMLANAKAALRYLKVLAGLNVIRRPHTGETRMVENRHSLGVRGFAGLSNLSFVRYLTLPDEDELFESGHVQTVDSLDISEGELDELEAQGVEPAELESKHQLAWFLDVLSPLYAQQFRAKVARQGQVARIQRQNQYLPSSVNIINQVEANKLLNYLENCRVANREHATLILLIYIMLLTSSSFERAKLFTLFADKGDGLFVNCDDEDDAVLRLDDGVGYNLILNEWVVPRLRLPFTTKESRFSGALIPAERIDLPVHSRRVKELIEHFFQSEKKISKPLFRMSVSKAQVTAFLRTVDERLTPAKVSNFLILNLGASTSISVAGYLFNRALPGSLARYYYSSHSPFEYQKIYNELIHRALPQCNFEWQSYHPSETLPSEPKYGFGARYVPSCESVRETIEMMSRELCGNWVYTKKQGFIEFHNLFTVYCIFAQSLLTGVRAVIDPFIGSKMLIDASGLAVFRDKDTEDQFHSRILPLHPLAIRICDEYERHRQIVFEKMLLLNPVFCRSEILKRDTTFLIQPENFSVVETRPSNIKSVLKAFNDLPINSNRKFLRSFLEREGLISEAIDAALGHASIGEPIGDSMSTFSFVDLKNQLFPALDKLIEEIGLKLLKGLNS
jgi:hypothetical protein